MVKLVDVATEAGVSAATVSRVLNNHPTVDPALAKRVRAAAKKLGYRPNAVARSLRKRRTQIWQLVVSDISNPFYTALTRGVEDVAAANGYQVVLGNSSDDVAREARYLEVAQQEQVAGCHHRSPTTRQPRHKSHRFRYPGGRCQLRRSTRVSTMCWRTAWVGRAWPRATSSTRDGRIQHA